MIKQMNMIFQYIKQCNEVYPNDVQRVSSTPFEVTSQNQVYSSKDNTCIEMFDLAMYATDKENESLSTAKDSASKDTNSIANINYVR